MNLFEQFNYLRNKNVRCLGCLHTGRVVIGSHEKGGHIYWDKRVTFKMYERIAMNAIALGDTKSNITALRFTGEKVYNQFIKIINHIAPGIMDAFYIQHSYDKAYWWVFYRCKSMGISQYLAKDNTLEHVEERSIIKLIGVNEKEYIAPSCGMEAIHGDITDMLYVDDTLKEEIITICRSFDKSVSQKEYTGLNNGTHIAFKEVFEKFNDKFNVVEYLITCKGFTVSFKRDGVLYMRTPNSKYDWDCTYNQMPNSIVFHRPYGLMHPKALKPIQILYMDDVDKSLKRVYQRLLLSGFGIEGVTPEYKTPTDAVHTVGEVVRIGGGLRKCLGVTEDFAFYATCNNIGITDHKKVIAVRTNVINNYFNQKPLEIDEKLMDRNKEYEAEVDFSEIL